MSGTTSSRIARHPILVFPERPRVRFEFEGQILEGYAGEPVAAALIASGVRVFGHSLKRGRPRGFFCAVGKCASCLMTVDDRPNVMVCVEPLRAGMKVRRQTGLGTLGAPD